VFLLCADFVDNSTKNVFQINNMTLYVKNVIENTINILRTYG